MHHHHSKLGVAAFGFAMGITWAIGTLLLSWVAWWMGWGSETVTFMGTLYRGYAPTFWGGIVGALWAFVEFFIGGVVLAAIYNGCTCKRHCVERGEGVSGGL